MSNTSSPPLRLELHASAWLGVAIAALMLLAVACVARSSLPWPALVLPPLLAWRAVARLQREGRVELVFRSDGTVAQVCDGFREVAVAPRAFVERGPLAVLEWHDGQRLRRTVTLPDTLDAAHRRQLRLWFGQHVRPDTPPRRHSHA